MPRILSLPRYLSRLCRGLLNECKHLWQLTWGIHMLGQSLVHLEHVGSGSKDLGQLLVAANLAFILGILQVVFLDIVPDGLHNLQHSLALSGALVLCSHVHAASLCIHILPRWPL